MTYRISLFENRIFENIHDKSTPIISLTSDAPKDLRPTSSANSAIMIRTVFGSETGARFHVRAFVDVVVELAILITNLLAPIKSSAMSITEKYPITVDDYDWTAEKEIGIRICSQFS